MGARARWAGLAGLTAAVLGGVLALPGGAAAALPGGAAAAPTARPADLGGCALGPHGRIQHVIYLTFDNVHYTRDNPNVPSELEQMPHLLNFLTGNGSFVTHHHTPLMSHTGTDLLSAATGLYGDRHGQPISNNYRYYHPDGSTSQANTFTYWTDRVYDGTTSPTDTTYSLLTPQGDNTPAPWVPYTRAGCDVGAIASSNAIVENVKPDVPRIFGPDSPEAQEVANATDGPYYDKETAEYGGLAVHCARGDALCAPDHRGVPDVLPDEPGGYDGFRMLAGSKYIAPQITDDHSQVVPDMFGRPITNHYAGDMPGFPGFDGMSAAVSLGYVAAMQEHGIPVTYAYLSDIHDNHAGGNAYGPGEAGFEQALRQEDAAFAAFFQRLARDGITAANTLFVVTADENDHFMGVQKSDCDGVTTPCTYGPGEIGEVSTNVQGLLATQRGNTTPFDLYAGAGPAFYIRGNPSPDAPVTRQLERDTLAVTATDPYTGQATTVNPLLADRTELRLLHMVTGDPARTPTFVAWGRADFYQYAGGTSCQGGCVSIEPKYAWNHGTTSPDIVTTWLGMAGPGVAHRGIDPSTWSDQTDIRPTMMALLGLRDDYTVDGRVLFEDLRHSAVPRGARPHYRDVVRLAQVYKQLDASVGDFGMDTLRAASAAAASGSTADDSRFTRTSAELAALGQRRDHVADDIQAALQQMEFGGRHVSKQRIAELTAQAEAVLAAAHQLAATS